MTTTPQSELDLPGNGREFRLSLASVGVLEYAEASSIRRARLVPVDRVEEAKCERSAIIAIRLLWDRLPPEHVMTQLYCGACHCDNGLASLQIQSRISIKRSSIVSGIRR
jgi:hypothetical protein